MKETGVADLWDNIIDRYCTSEEKKILSKLSEQQYGYLENHFNRLIDHIKMVLNTEKPPIKS